MAGGYTVNDLIRLLLHVAWWLLLAPLLPGIINRVKSWVAGRRGPPILQLYFDLARLWKKSVVMSTLASPAFIAGPAVAWVAVVGAAMLVPLGPVVVFSSAELPNETQIAYAMDIQACIIKPLSYPELREKLRILKEYWLDYEAGASA